MVKGLATITGYRISVPAIATILISTISAENQRLPEAGPPTGTQTQGPQAVISPAILYPFAGTRVKDAAAETQELGVRRGHVAAVMVGDPMKRLTY